MAIFGRRQPHAPIILRGLAPAGPAAARVLVVQRVAQAAARRPPPRPPLVSAPPPSGPAANTLYLLSTASSTLATADNLSATRPSSESSAATLVGTQAGWLQLYAQGNAQPGVGASEPPQDGNGFLWDVTTLEGQSLLAGNYTPTLKLAVSAGTLSNTDIHLRVSKRTSGGVYTTIAESTLSAQTLTTTPAVYSLPAAAGALTNFAVGDKLYADVILHVGTNGTGSAAANVLLYENGGANESFTLPSWVPTTVPGRVLLFGAGTSQAAASRRYARGGAILLRVPPGQPAVGKALLSGQRAAQAAANRYFGRARLVRLTVPPPSNPAQPPAGLARLFLQQSVAGAQARLRMPLPRLVLGRFRPPPPVGSIRWFIKT